ncbi:MAG: hypothetical protein GX434_06945 [Peptococcaceae bacterium]|nr:hypothetical protein [Peptococcaceae bacterium]
MKIIIIVAKNCFLGQKITHNQLAGPIFALILLLLFNLIFTKDFFLIEIKDGHLYGSLILFPTVTLIK